MTNYTGKVNGIDAQERENEQIKCYAFINIDRENYIQVSTTNTSLQTALELACIKDVDVEVTYDENDPTKPLSRVRILDR